MGTTAAPRIDSRLRRELARSPATSTPAEVTRMLGNLAWELGLPRPSYQQVRVLVRATRRPARVQTTPGRLLVRLIGGLYEYPGPFLGDMYRRNFTHSTPRRM